MKIFFQEIPDEKSVIYEVQKLVNSSLEAFSLEDIIDCSEDLSEAEIKWAKENLTVKVVRS